MLRAQPGCELFSGRIQLGTNLGTPQNRFNRSTMESCFLYGALAYRPSHQAFEHHLERAFLVFSIALYQVTNSLHHFYYIFFLEAVAHSLISVLIESVQVACHFREVASPHLQLMENLGFCKLARGSLGNGATNHHPNNHG